MASERKSPWGTLFYGVIFLVMGIGGYLMFDKLEREGGGKVRLPAVVIIAYKTLGKVGVLGVFGGIGGLMLVMGTARLISGPSQPGDTGSPPPPGETA